MGKHRNSQRHGFVYLFALGVVFFLTMAGAAVLMRGVTETNQSERYISQMSALHLADAAVDQATINLRTPTDPSDDLCVLAQGACTLATGTYGIESTTALPGGSLWQVIVRGTSTQDANFPRRLEVIYQLTGQSAFQFALFGNQQVNVSGSAITDSYNSQLGPYNNNPGPTYNADHHGDVGTNATTAGGVTVSGSIFIDGQVAVGTGASNPTSVVTGYNPAFITGGTAPPSDTQDVVAQSNPFPMPDVVVPQGLTCNDFTVTGNQTVTLSPTGGPLGNGTYCYKDLTIQGGGTFTASGTVKVYLTGQLKATGNTVVGVSTSPSSMTFLVSSTGGANLQDSITGSTQFYGGLYGPKATVTISGNADVYGSIVAQTVNVTGSASIHYDTALSTTQTVTNVYRAAVVSWREL